MRAADNNDATLYLQLMATVQGQQFSEARRWAVTNMPQKYSEMETTCPLGGVERDRLVTILGFFESAGALVSRGLLHEDVFFDAPFGLGVYWPRMGPLVEDWQASSGDSMRWHNVLWLGRRYQAWLEGRVPKVDERPPDREPESGSQTGFRP